MRLAAKIAGGVAAFAVVMAAVLAANGDIHPFGRPGVADHSAYVKARTHSVDCWMERMELGDPKRTPRRRPVYSCHNSIGQWGCFIEDEGLVADVTDIVRRTFAATHPAVRKPDCIKH